MNNLTNFFDKIYCVNLDRRKERWEECINQFLKWDIKEVQRISAVDGNDIDITQYNTKLKPGELGLVLTNIEIIKEAKKQNLSSILILEDDIIFTDEIKNISAYFDLLPKDWDMLYFGGNHNTHMGVKPPQIINDKVSKLHNTYTTHCIGIKNNMFDILLSVLPKLNGPLDVEYAKLQKIFKIYSFYPAIAKQRVGFSDIQNKTLDYDWLIK
jgi:GR25 family glycosyltransferase involved in LPS biosynthesis